MNSYGPRVLLNIFAGAILTSTWLWVATRLAGPVHLRGETLFWGAIVWSAALLYLLSYRFPALRKQLRLPLLLPVGLGLASWGYYQTAVSVGRDQAWWLSWAAFIPSVLLAGPLAISSIGHWIYRSLWYREIVRHGDGDNAQWRTRSEYHQDIIELPRRRNGQLGWLDCLYLGMTQFRHDVTPRHIGLRTDVHLITYGMAGSGKAATSGFINLALYGGPAFVIDQKREYFKSVGRRRTELGDVYNCDPFGQGPSARFNPLAGIDVYTEEGLRLIQTIRNALIIPEENTNAGPHFSDNAGTIFEGITTWVCASLPPADRNLVTVYRLLNSQEPSTGAYDPEVFVQAVAEMSECPIGVCSQAAKLLDDAGDREGGSFKTTLSKSIKWMASPAMQHHLSGHDFEMKELATAGSRKPSIFVSVGMGNEHEHQRYLRMMVATALYHIGAEFRRTGKKPSPSVYFGLDEFPQYARGLEAITTAGFATLRSAGCLLHILAQKRSQLKAILGEQTSLLEQNATVQVLGVNNDSEDTAAWVSEQLGSHIVTRLAPGEPLLSERKERTKEPLMTRRMVQDTLTQLSRNQIVFPAKGGPPMWLSRMAYKPFLIHGKRCFDDLDLGELFD
ncbi:type IV secretory system conjugative DNA transfer family protein [Botrimarina hoheduenensis]|nr:type IV secretory system conjugative DNA transfer family protein [Botrimarina hoheduenensis]